VLVWIAIAAVVGFFLPLWPGGAIFIVIATLLTGLIGWAKAVKFWTNSGRPLTNAAAFQGMAVMFATQAAVVGMGFLIGRAAGHFFGR
jgi:hypothetical protein